MRTIKQIVGENIKARRKELKIKQREMAKTTGLTVQALSRLEKGKHGARNLNLIANALQCTEADLYIDSQATASPTTESLLKIVGEIEKELKQIKAENTRLKGILKMIPPRIFVRLVRQLPDDPAARIAMAYLTGDRSPLEEPLIQDLTKADLEKTKGKTAK